MINPLFTVLIDTYNHERFIEEAIVSVLEQTFPTKEIEVLVVDDGSTDRTSEIVKKFEPRVRSIRKANGGQASAFNAGIPEARGEIVAFLDGDDWWAKDKLKVIANYFAAHPNVGVVGHGIYESDFATGKVSTTVPNLSCEIAFEDVVGGTFFRQMMCFFGTSRVAIRRDVLKRVLPVPESLVVEADEFMAIMGTAFSSAGLIREPLTFYRLHEGNLFQIRKANEVKSRRIQNVLAALADQLRVRLASACVARDVIQAIVEPLEVGSTRLRLTLDGGKPWETFRAERAEFRLAYSKASPAYWMFKAFVLSCTLVLPPRTFYALRNWYSRSSWRRWRGALGEPSTRAEISKAEPGLAVPTFAKELSTRARIGTKPS
jgi:glycosyltransferase involved in cell wall biosynthesis